MAHRTIQDDDSVEAWEIPPELIPDYENMVTEDDAPVDNIYSEKQQRLLTEALHSSWTPGRPFVALANIGLFYAMREPPLVPDMLLSLDVSLPEEVWQKRHRSYFVWEYGRPPSVVIEVVSNKIGGEQDTKLATYAAIGVSYYVIHDPEGHLSETTLRVYKRIAEHYVETVERFFPEVGLGLTLWDGRYEDLHAEWLRWCDQDRNPIPTGAEWARAESERAEAERERADSERERAESERKRADAERERAARYEQMLRDAGIDPDAS